MKRKHCGVPILFPPKIQKLENKNKNNMRTKKNKNKRKNLREGEIMFKKFPKADSGKEGDTSTHTGKSSEKNVLEKKINTDFEIPNKGKLTRPLKKHFKFRKKSTESVNADKRETAFTKISKGEIMSKKCPKSGKEGKIVSSPQSGKSSGKNIAEKEIHRDSEIPIKGNVTQPIKKHFQFCKTSTEYVNADKNKTAFTTGKISKDEQEKRNSVTDCQKQKKINPSKKVSGLSESKKTWKHKKFKVECVKQKDLKTENKKSEPCLVSIKRPSNSDEFSSNWKIFSKTLFTEEKKKVRKRSRETKEENKEKKSEMKNQTNTVENEKSTEIWFDGVDASLIKDEDTSKEKKISASDVNNPLVKPGSFKGMTNVVAMDCEMVGVGEYGSESILARISIVNRHGQCIYDKFVKPTEKVVDYRTAVSGVRPEDMEKGEDFSTVQYDVYKILKGRILVGHALENDFKVLYFNHPAKMTRDTSRYKPFRQLFHGAKPSLKKLSAQLLNVLVQQGEHSSVQDAQAAMKLYVMHKKEWEKDIALKKHAKRFGTHKIKKDEKESVAVS